MSKNKIIIFILSGVVVLGLGIFFILKFLCGGSYETVLDKYYKAWKEYDEKGMAECFHPNFNVEITDHNEEEKMLDTGYWYTYGDKLEIEDVIAKDPEYKDRNYMGETINYFEEVYKVDVTEYKVLNISSTYKGQGNPAVEPDYGTITAKEVLVVKIGGKWYLISQPYFEHSL